MFQLNKLFLIFITFAFFYIYSIEKIILITGGCGYIGSATSLYMLKKGYKVIVIDKKLPESQFFKNAKKINSEHINNLKFEDLGRDSLIDNIIFIKSDYADKKVLKNIFDNFEIEAVFHFAAHIEVGLSVKNPKDFYKNNVIKTLKLLSQMNKFNIKKIIFPSSAAVYGLPKVMSIRESDQRNPINPYGNTKNIIEAILEDYAKAYNFKAIALRFFNASGALPEYDLGERHDPETHVLPLLLKSAYEAKDFYIFGDDYNTPDGTCIRDYLHINDLARAHYLALKYMNKLDIKFEVFNLGTGSGYSIKELISTVENITGLKVKATVSKRRPGDPDYLVADSSRAQEILHWEPRHSSLSNIVKSAHDFHAKH